MAAGVVIPIKFSGTDLEAHMAKIWKDAEGRLWELKIEDGENWHRKQAEGESAWTMGTPPGWTDKPKDAERLE